MLDDQMTPMDAELAMTSALGNYLKLSYQAKGMEKGGDFLMGKLFPSQAEKRSNQLMALEIMLKRRQLGLPENTSEYEDLLNERQTVLDPGRMITLGSVATQSEKPLLKLGASPFLKGFQHGPAGRAIGAIGRIFGK